MPCHHYLYTVMLICIFSISCSKEESIIEPDFEKAIIESITLSAVADYDNLDDPGKPDFFYEIIFEPSTFVTTGMVIQDADLPTIWEDEIPLPGDIEASYFIRFSDYDNGALDDQIFAVTLRPKLAWPNTTVEYSKDGNAVSIQLRYE